MSTYTGLTAAVVTYNRRDELEKCIQSIQRQTPQVGEILVFDNASTDGTAEMVARKFPEVRYVESEVNLGCPAGRNRAIRIASQSHVLCVDDDGTLQDNAVATVDSWLRENPDTAVIAGLVVDDYHQYSVTEPRPVFSFSGGIACIDKKSFIALGGYHEDGLRQGEEGEFSYSLYDAGLPVVQHPAMKLDHHVRVSEERWRAVIQSSARQTVLTGFKKIPLPLLPFWLTSKQPAQAASAWRRGHFGAYIQGIAEALTLAPRTLKARQPATYRAALAGTRFFRPPAARNSIGR